MLYSPEFRAWWPNHEVLGAQEGKKTLNHPQVGYLVFERLTFQVLDTPDFKVTVYTPSEEAGTPRKLEQLLAQWHQHKGQGSQAPKTAHNRTQAQQSEQDTVQLWLRACCKREEGVWIANNIIMTSYANWCEAQRYEPKKAKGVSQSLAASGFKVGVNKRVVDEHHRRKMARGVRGLVIL
jgi:phage/plasmid-associated DNA primase